MAIARVDSKFTALAAGPITATYGTNPAVGNLMTAFCYHRDNTSLVTISDTLVSTWNQIGTAEQFGGAVTRFVTFWYAIAASAGANTVQAVNGGNRYAMNIGLYSGTSITLDQTNQNQGNSNTISSGNMVTAASSILAIGGASGDGGSNTWTKAAAFTADPNNAGSDVFVEYQIGGAATYNTTSTTSFGIDWACIGAVFKEGGGGATSWGPDLSDQLNRLVVSHP